MKNVEELSLLGDLYGEQKMVPEAAEIYGRDLSSSPEMGEKKITTTTPPYMISGGRLDDAERVLGTMKPEDASRGGVELLRTRADLLAAEKKWPEERRVLDPLLTIAPLDGQALVSLGQGLRRGGRRSTGDPCASRGHTASRAAPTWRAWSWPTSRLRTGIMRSAWNIFRKP